MGLKEFLTGGEQKLWQVEDHRVEEARIQTGTKEVMKIDGDPTRGGRSYREEEAVYSHGYRCVDCHKEEEDREKFREEECFEVV